MIEHFHAHGAAFNANEVRVLTAAFSWVATVRPHGPSSRGIIEAAKQGERD